MTSQRLEYIDAAKGVLIILVVVFHFTAIVHGKWGLDCYPSPYTTFSNTTWPYVALFYMPAFFVITGMCSNFFKDRFAVFSFRQFKLLILPSLTIGLISDILYPLCLGTNFNIAGMLNYRIDTFLKGGAWFTTTLCLSKILLSFLLRHFKLTTTALVVFGLYVVGAGLVIAGFDDKFVLFFRNFWWVKFDLLMPVFLFCGHIIRYVKDNYEKDLLSIKGGVIAGIVYIGCVMLSKKVCHQTPYLVMDMIMPDIPSAIIILICGLTGPVFFLSLFKNLRINNSLLVTIGSYTLVIYLIHWNILEGCLRLLKDVIASCPDYQAWLCFGMAIVFTITMSCCVGWLVDKKYTRWMLGKF